MTIEPVVFVVEDDPAVRGTIEQLIQGTSRPVKCFDSAESFLAVSDWSCPGCLILDVRMPGMSGMELLEKLFSEGIQLPVIMITGHGDIPLTVRAMKKGAFEFLEKPYRPGHLLETVERAIHLDSKFRQQSVRRQVVEMKINRLTNKERMVLKGLLTGRTNQDIASELDVSLRTVQHRRTTIMKKMEVESKAELSDLVFPVAWPEKVSVEE